MKNWRINQNYIIIALLSLISVFFLPMLGSEIGIGFKLPNTTAGWIVYVITKLCIVAINMLTLDQFVKQAKVNVEKNERFKEADDYFTTQEDKEEYLPTPKQFLWGVYRKKMVSTTICSILGVFGLTQAILSFDWISMLTYLFTVTFGLIFGWITMNEVENYWTDTYYKLYKREKQKEKENVSISGERVPESGRAGTEE